MVAAVKMSVIVSKERLDIREVSRNRSLSQIAVRKRKSLRNTMVAAVKMSVIVSKERLDIRKRPLKLLKAGTHCTNNIDAIRQTKPEERVKYLYRKYALQTEKLVLASADAHPQRMQGISDSVADSAVTQLSSIDDLVIACVDRSTPFSHRVKIAFGVMTAIIISAGIGTIWMPNEQNEPTNVAVKALVPPSSVSQRSPAVATRDSENTPPPIASFNVAKQESDVEKVRTGSNSITHMQNPTHPPSASHPAQIERLRTENKILRKEIDVLDAETNDLNIKLMQLELAMTAWKLRAEPLTEVRNVYNFINEPEEGVLTSNLIPNSNTELSWASEADESAQNQVSVQHDNPIQSQDSFLHDDTAMAWESQFEMEFVESLAGPSGTGDINQ